MAGGDEVGFRNRMRARWASRPAARRAAVVVAVEAAASVGFYRLDHSLGYGAAVVFTILWMRKVPALPWRLGLQCAFLTLFALGSAFGSASLSIVIIFGLAFALSWIPHHTKLRVPLGGGGRRSLPITRSWALPVAALLIAVSYPFYATRLFTIPIFGAFPDVGTGVVIVVFVMMAVGLNIVVGYAGLLDLGYVAFYATGAYTAAWLASAQFAGQKCPTPGVSIADCTVAAVPRHSFSLGGIGVPMGTGGFHVSIFLVLLIAGLITAAFGIVIGLPTLRLRGDYLAIVTLGFGEILPQVARNGDNLGGFNLTNGPNGITPLDSPGFGNHLSNLTSGVLPSNYLTCCKTSLFGHHIGSADIFFWTALVLLVFTVFCSLRLRESRLGRAWVAIREDETAAAAMGIPLMRTKTWAYASGAFFGGIAGAYYASFKSATFPGDFFFNISVFILCMVILGGMGNIWGVIVGAAFLEYLDREGLANTGDWINRHIHVGGWHPNLDVPLYSSGIYGVIIVAVMLFRPEGLLPSKRRAAELHDVEPHDKPLYDLQHEGA
ncbi:MAG: branched-chain amino acid ABC transporter permease [Actinomycetes bacterium]